MWVCVTAQVVTEVAVAWSTGNVTLNERTWTHRTGAFVVNESAIMIGSGQLVVSGSAAVLSKIGNSVVQLDVPVDIQGGATLQSVGGTLVLSKGGRWDANIAVSGGMFRLAGGEFNMSAAASWVVSDASVSVEASAVVQILAPLAWPSSVSLEVSGTGALALLATSSITGSTRVRDSAAVTNGAAVNMHSLLVAGNATVAVAAELAVTDSFTLASGAVNVAASSALRVTGTAQQLAGVIDGPGAVALESGTWTVVGGLWTGAGSLTVSGDAVLVLAVTGSPLRIERTVGG